MTGLPVVRLSGIGPVDATVVGAAGVAELELEFEHDSDWSALGDGENGEDPDSNSEGYYGNDYPEVDTLFQLACYFIEPPHLCAPPSFSRSVYYSMSTFCRHVNDVLIFLDLFAMC